MLSRIEDKHKRRRTMQECWGLHGAWETDFRELIQSHLQSSKQYKQVTDISPMEDMH